MRTTNSGTQVVFWVVMQCCGRIPMCQRSMLSPCPGWSACHWYPATTLHGITAQKTKTSMFISSSQWKPQISLIQ